MFKGFSVGFKVALLIALTEGAVMLVLSFVGIPSQDWQGFVLQSFSELARLGVVVIDPSDQFCDEQSCSPYINGRSAYRDEHHLSNYGAAQLRPSLIQVYSSLR